MTDAPATPTDVAEGHTFTHSRTFTRADVEQFVELSGDENPSTESPTTRGAWSSTGSSPARSRRRSAGIWGTSPAN